jgi:hypothetical protein
MIKNVFAFPKENSEPKSSMITMTHPLQVTKALNEHMPPSIECSIGLE